MTDEEKRKRAGEDELRRAIEAGCLIQDDSAYADAPPDMDWSKIPDGPYDDEIQREIERYAREELGL